MIANKIKDYTNWISKGKNTEIIQKTNLLNEKNLKNPSNTEEKVKICYKLKSKNNLKFK